MNGKRIHYGPVAMTTLRQNRRQGRATTEVLIHCPVIGRARDELIENHRANIKSLGMDQETVNPLWVFRSQCTLHIGQVRCPWCLPRALAVLVRTLGVEAFSDAAVEARAIVEAEQLAAFADDAKKNRQQFVMPGVR